MKPVVWTDEAEATLERLIAYLIRHNSNRMNNVRCTS